MEGAEEKEKALKSSLQHLRVQIKLMVGRSREQALKVLARPRQEPGLRPTKPRRPRKEVKISGRSQIQRQKTCLKNLKQAPTRHPSKAKERQARALLLPQAIAVVEEGGAVDEDEEVHLLWWYPRFSQR